MFADIAAMGIGTDDDAKNFNGVLNGQGEWENVNIPHFGEPAVLQQPIIALHLP